MSIRSGGGRAVYASPLNIKCSIKKKHASMIKACFSECSLGFRRSNQSLVNKFNTEPSQQLGEGLSQFLFAECREI